MRKYRYLFDRELWPEYFKLILGVLLSNWFPIAVLIWLITRD